MEIRRRARDLLWIHTHYNKGNAPKGQESELVVNKERTKKHAEVYTPREAVDYIHKSALVATLQYHKQYEYIHNKLNSNDKSMITLFKGRDFYNRLEARDFIELAELTTLEPCCGSGNFLETIITDKIRFIAYAYKKKGYYNPCDPSFYLSCFRVASTLYAIDLQPDNVKISRARVFHIIAKACARYYKRPMPLSIARQFAYMLRINIIHGDFLLDRRVYCFYMLGAKGEVNYIFKTFAGYNLGGWHSYTENETWDLDSNNTHIFTKPFLQMRDIYQHWAKLQYTYAYEAQRVNIQKFGFTPLIDTESYNPYKQAKGITFSKFHDEIEAQELKEHKAKEREAKKAKREALKARELAEKGALPKETQMSLF